eukprot:TRINITY_DN33326_c0_g1_i2.p1 TRINITY_DN33326_c0_g1~~TRINITY_DN33326_c0_g1_i2.p1  ORF type:complete len:251 (-),score=46.40 TRINITY_DN33326_c0_g1_i2:381-1133(-)
MQGIREGVATVDPDIRDLEVDPFAKVLRRKVETAGGILAYLRLCQEEDKIDPLPVFTLYRMGQYKPCCVESGLRVIRRMKTYQRVWTEVEHQEALAHAKYDFVVNQRDDAYWQYPLALGAFAKYMRHAAEHKEIPQVFTKSCCEWDGLSDKVFFLNRAGAAAFLSNIYRDYYHVCTPELDKSQNAEEHFLKYIDYLGLKHTRVPFQELSVVDGQWTKTHTSDGQPHDVLCARRFYAVCCAPLPDDVKFCV